MKKIGDKILAYMLTLIVCVSMVNVPVYAQENTMTEITTESEEVTEDLIEAESTSDNDTATITEEANTDEADDSTWDKVTMEKVFEGENFKVTYTLSSYWDTGYSANIKIENTGDSIMENWYLEFESKNKITSTWNAEISENTESEYIIKNAGWNQDIPAGGSVEFGISGEGAFKGFPDIYELVSTISEVEEEDYLIEYTVDSDWGSGFTGNIKITNNTDVTIEDWVLEFDFDRNITNLWNGVIEKHEGNHYVIKNAGYNATIRSGETISIGFEGKGFAEQDCLSNVVLYKYVYEPIESQEEYTITFNCLAENVINAPAEQTVSDNSVAEEPVVPSRVGYSFCGWYTDELCTNRFDFSTPVTANLTLYARWQRINDNLTDNIIDLGDIEYLKSLGLIEVGYNTYGDISYIYGDFWNKEVNSIEDVVGVLNASASLWGPNFYAVAGEVSVQTVGEGDELVSYYTYSTMRGNVSVMGSQIKLMVDSTGKISALFNSYDKRVSGVNATPRITQEAAAQIALDDLLASDMVTEFVESSLELIKTYYGEDAIDRAQLIEGIKESTTVSGSLMIQCVDENKPKLVYAIQLSNALSIGGEEVINLTFSEMYLIAANGNAGEIIRKSSINRDVNLTATDASNVSRNIEVKEDGSQYQFIDETRNISTYKSTYKVEWLFFREYNFPGAIVTVEKNSTPDANAVSVHANMTEVYDYYKNVLSRDSYDDQGSAVISTYSYEGLDDNALWEPTKKQFIFTKTGDYFKAKDIVAHEFTHAVYDSIVYTDIYSNNANYYGETGGLMEAYADIMGCLIEGKTGNDMWTIGEDGKEIIRDMSNPTAYGQVDKYSDVASYVIDSNYDSGGVHIVGGVVNKAAYLMMTDSRTSTITLERWAEIFYGSMYNLPEDATFLQARESIVAVAKKKGFNSNQLQAIKDAFDQVGVVEQDAIRVVLTWGSTPRDLDSHLTGPSESSTNRFHLYYANRDIGQAGTDNWQADLDYDDTTSFGPEVITVRKFVPGEYYFYVHNYGGASNSTALSYSGAVVRVYRGNEAAPVNEFNVTKDQVGKYWNVFKMVIGSDGSVNIEAIDTYSDSVLYQ